MKIISKNKYMSTEVSNNSMLLLLGTFSILGILTMQTSNNIFIILMFISLFIPLLPIK